MLNLFYKDGRFFKIDSTVLKTEANRTDIINSLYLAVYEEFKGASDNKRYSNLNPVKKLEKVNAFASEWLNKRGLL